jgi:hypothetical protein
MTPSSPPNARSLQATVRVLTAGSTKAAVEEDSRYTKDGFLRATGRRKSAPSLFPEFPSEAQPMPPWEVERQALDIDG